MKQRRKKLSVITTFYNAELFIMNALGSVFQQQHGDYDFEYVIVDDKSPDGSRKIVENFIEEHKLSKQVWRLITPPENLGCGGARRFGIEKSKGDYLMFLDADDYYMHTDFCKRAMETIQTNNADIVEYGLVYNTINGDRTNSSVSQQIIVEDNPEYALQLLFRDNAIKFNVWTKIYRREITHTYTYSNSRTFEDVRTIPRWVANAKKIIVMPTCEINYRAAAGSIIREDGIKARVGTITAIAELFPDFAQWPSVLKSMYSRSMVDFIAIMENKDSDSPGFNEMSNLNTFMLSKIFPNSYMNYTYNLDVDVPPLEFTRSDEVNNAKHVDELV